MERYWQHQDALLAFHNLFNERETIDERAVAIVGATFLDNLLEGALINFMVDEEKEVKKLIGLTKQAVYTLGLLHAELAGKLLTNKREAIRLRTAMMQVEAVMKMLNAAVNIRLVAPKRRNVGNPWFKRGTLFRSAVDVLRRAQTPMTVRQIADPMLAGKMTQPTRKQVGDLQAAILAALRKRNGETVTGHGAPAQWTLKYEDNR